jgi:hypothetical protein
VCSSELRENGFTADQFWTYINIGFGGQFVVWIALQLAVFCFATSSATNHCFFEITKTASHFQQGDRTMSTAPRGKKKAVSKAKRKPRSSPKPYKRGRREEKVD